MSAQNVPLTEHGQEFVDSIVKRGEHESAAEVVDTALRQMERKQRAHEAKVEAFQEAAQVGIDDLDNGRCVEVPRDQLREFIAGLGVQAGERASRANGVVVSHAVR